MLKPVGYINQKGMLSPIILIIGVALIAFFLISQTFDFQSKLFGQLYEKEQSSAQVATSSYNYLLNPGCEVDTQEWSVSNGTLTRNTNQHKSGVASCKVAFYPGSSPIYGMTEKNTTSRTPGYRYTFTGSAWIKANSGNSAISKPVKIKLKQTGGVTSSNSVYGDPVNLTSTWQLVSASTLIYVSDRLDIEMEIIQDNAANGDVFFADDISLTKQNPAPLPLPTPTPTPAPQIIVAGYVYIDSNSNGVQDSGENDLPNTTVKLTKSGVVIGNYTTNSNGWYYTLTPATGSDLIISYQPPAGYTNSSPASVTFIGNTNFFYDFGIKPTPVP